VILTLHVFGRPAPQGSKDFGSAGQLIEQSPYLPAWQQAVKRAAFETYKAMGVEPWQLPIFPAGTPVVVQRCTFYVGPDQCRADGTDEPLGAPDVDKLLRAVLDPLGGGKRGTARLFADDSQVKTVLELGKERAAPGRPTGALIIVSDRR
jgi:hypothetical protein